jgi:hypothetical protein
LPARAWRREVEADWSLAVVPVAPAVAFWSLPVVVVVPVLWSAVPGVVLLGDDCVDASFVSVPAGAWAAALDWALLLISLVVAVELAVPLDGAVALADASVEPVLVDGVAAALLVDGFALLALMSVPVLPEAALVPLGVWVLVVGLALPAAEGFVLAADWVIAELSAELVPEAVGDDVLAAPVLPVVVLQWSEIMLTELTWKLLLAPVPAFVALVLPALLLALTPLADWPVSWTWCPTWFWSWSVLPVSW